MPYFDRFDICEAYLALEIDYNVAGVLQERGRQVAAQLNRIGFKPGAAFNGFQSLSANGREIYNEVAERLMLGNGGYRPCACGPCMETAIGRGHPYCHECVEAGCIKLTGGECQVEREEGDESDHEPYTE